MIRHLGVFSALLVLLCGTSGCARSADISGTWNAKTTSSQGVSEQTITFTQAGNTFGGQMITSQGAVEPVQDGKIAGQQMEFVVVRKRANGKTDMVPYKGRVTGDEIVGTFVGASGRTVTWSATQQSRSIHR
jgi:hypothetical protein